MFFPQLQRVFFEHAKFYRAITIDEYRQGIVYNEFVEKEFLRICQTWNRASRKIDMRSMAYPIEQWQYLELIRYYHPRLSEWEYRIEMPKEMIYLKAFSD
jgi:hypothetical protein